MRFRKNLLAVWSNKLINFIHRAYMSCMENEGGIFPSLFYPGPVSFANVDQGSQSWKVLELHFSLKSP